MALPRTVLGPLPFVSDTWEKFVLALHPDKTRLIEFGRYAAQQERITATPL